MARSIQQIEQDLSTLSEQAASLADRLEQSYTHYLQQLGQSLRKQLAIASYQVCTQTYPEAFLALSLNQRQMLQQELRLLGKEAIAQLNSFLKPDAEQQSPAPTQPQHLLRSMQHLEEKIQETLQVVSVRSNLVLRDAGILSDRLPAPLMETALQNEEALAPSAHLPNLLQLSVEAVNEENEEPSTVVEITAVRLRLSELEFSDPILGVERHRIRQLLATAKQLAKQHQQYERELAIGRAELAWRASWSED